MRIFLTPILLVGLLASGVSAQDISSADTIRLVGGPLIVGQSVPIDLVIVNEEDLAIFDVPLALWSLTGGFASFDSAVFVNRMDDPMTLPLRYILDASDDHVMPDTLAIAALQGMGNCLPVGNDAVAQLYFTGISAGLMLADETELMDEEGHRLRSTLLFPCGGEPDDAIWTPVVEYGLWEVIEAPQPPVISVTENVVRTTAGTLISFEVNAESPAGSNVTLELVDFTGYDTPMDPTYEPALAGESPATFSWQTTTDDIGVWKAEIQACDDEGRCASTTVVFQIVTGENYLVSFKTTATEQTDRSLGIAVGNFDFDPYPEMISSGLPYFYWPAMSLYDYDASQQVFEKVCAAGDEGFPNLALQVGFINDDDDLDAVVVEMRGGGEGYVDVWRGDGDNGLEILTESPTSVIVRGGVLAEVNGDQYLDYIVTSMEEVKVHTSSAAYLFTVDNTISVPDTALTINSADFNQDGNGDLAVGTTEGVQIYLNDGTGGFTAGEFYPQAYKATAIEVTNRGSDFNNDNRFDLCVSTPSIGATYSEIYVYLGQGDGSFEQRPVRTVRGYVLGNCIGDFNGDNQLDIAYVNGGENNVGILFGDGNGDFTNEIRFFVNHNFLAQIECADFDLDGDMDIVAIGQEAGYWKDNAIFMLDNQLDPAGFAVSTLETTGLNNVDIQLASSSGKVLNSVMSTMPGAQFYRRNIDNNEAIDAFARVALVEAGAYQVTAKPRPDLPAGETFSVEYTVNGEQYRLASNVAMSEAGYQFDIYPGGASPVYPAPGVFTADNPPTFQWTGQGQFDFQLASDIEFTNLLADVTVDGNTYVGPELTSKADTATFYWRIRPAGTEVFEGVYPVNILFGVPTGVDDDNPQIPGKFNLAQNYPNPFNPQTWIGFSLPEACRVHLAVYNIIGQKICNLADRDYDAGEHFVIWDGKNSSGQDVASGFYLYQIHAGKHSATRKMILLK
ncbi:MAG: T9SS type A sorting domain-containing protein [Candidatus Zixiibacteriota bacterium]|nr:MAG: T9SS type A sorting domain-containing protein [candidate division Zixibacteria bacterium]